MARWQDGPHNVAEWKTTFGTHAAPARCNNDQTHVHLLKDKKMLLDFTIWKAICFCSTITIQITNKIIAVIALVQLAAFQKHFLPWPEFEAIVL